jgi:predicted transcriptional regulator
MRRGLNSSSVRKYKRFIEWLAESRKEVSNLLRYDKELEVLLIISRFEDIGVTKHRLEKEAHINGKRLNEILFRLRSNGLIYQLTDGKKHLIFPTEKGKEVIEIIVNLSRLEVKIE